MTRSIFLALGFVISIDLVMPSDCVLAQESFRVDVVDAESGWPVPLVELRTVSGLRFVSDNAGTICIDAPELMGVDTWFHVRGQGYTVAADGFGFRGVRLAPRRGGARRLEVTREVLAKRIGRITGSGLFAESKRFGEYLSHRDSGIVGSDSVQTAEHNDRLYWVWGDSNLAKYPLGIFHASGAESSAEPISDPKPPLVFPLEYVRDSSKRPRAVAKIEGRGPTWLSCLISVPDNEGRNHLVATYAKIDPPLATWQRGLCEWNDKTQQFERTKTLWQADRDEGDPPAIPHGHVSFWTDEEEVRWALVGNPFPVLKFRASYEAWLDPDAWEIVDAPKSLESNLGDVVRPHSGSIAWNEHRQMWVAVFMEAFGKPSAFGEIWYTESDSPFGPWAPAIKILSHRNYSFYNPRIQPWLANKDDAYLFFEGTYTVLFANATNDDGLRADYPEPTPRYEYNQILYRLDFSEIDRFLEEN